MLHQAELLLFSGLVLPIFHSWLGENCWPCLVSRLRESTVRSPRSTKTQIDRKMWRLLGLLPNWPRQSNRSHYGKDCKPISLFSSQSHNDRITIQGWRNLIVIWFDNENNTGNLDFTLALPLSALSRFAPLTTKIIVSPLTKKWTSTTTTTVRCCYIDYNKYNYNRLAKVDFLHFFAKA